MTRKWNQTLAATLVLSIIALATVASAANKFSRSSFGSSSRYSSSRQSSSSYRARSSSSSRYQSKPSSSSRRSSSQTVRRSVQGSYSKFQKTAAYLNRKSSSSSRSVIPAKKNTSGVVRHAAVIGKTPVKRQIGSSAKKRPGATGQFRNPVARPKLREAISAATDLQKRAVHNQRTTTIGQAMGANGKKGKRKFVKVLAFLVEKYRLANDFGFMGPGGSFEDGAPVAEEFDNSVVVEPEAEEADLADITIADVRFVDPGFVPKELGPRYRISLRNAGTLAVEKEFEVLVIAGDGKKLDETSPLTIHKVAGLPLDETVQFDVRLPVESLNMGGDEKDTKPFSQLIVIVDGEEVISESDKENNLLSTPAKSIPPVDLKLSADKPLHADAGGKAMISGEGLGRQPGVVILKINGIGQKLNVQVWHPLGLLVQVPNLLTDDTLEGELLIERADGQKATVKIDIQPKGKTAQQ